MNNLLTNWFNIPDKSALTESNICEFCAADKDECGEVPYCCYKEAYKEYLDEICRQ